MKLRIYSIYDQKSEVFNTPFFQQTHGEAERSFRSAVNDEKTLFSKYPEDYDLYYIGDYDDNEGKIKPEPSPQHMVKAIQCVNKKPDLGNVTPVTNK